MPAKPGHFPRPVKRAGARRYLLLSLLSFAGSVVLTRLFLSLTGYPQIGGRTLHIAHVLWGGLLLFIASLLPLMLANRWAFAVSGVLSGVGVGLFIDEVGKFITQNNNYFYPPAAPIIYGFFLLVVLLYSEVGRPPHRDARSELYRAVDGLEEVFDHDLSDRERAELEARLSYVADQTEQPDLARLAVVLLDFIRSDAVALIAPNPGLWSRMVGSVRGLAARWLHKRPLKWALVIGMGLLGGLWLLNLLLWVALSASTAQVAGSVVPQRIILTLTGPVHAGEGPVWLLIRLGLEAAVGISLLVGGRLLLGGRDKMGAAWGYYGLLLSLTTVNLLVFYFDQFRALADTLVQGLLLWGLAYYRHHYAVEASSQEAAQSARRVESGP
jgi:hypothetical protein